MKLKTRKASIELNWIDQYELNELEWHLLKSIKRTVVIASNQPGVVTEEEVEEVSEEARSVREGRVRRERRELMKIKRWGGGGIAAEERAEAVVTRWVGRVATPSPIFAVAIGSFRPYNQQKKSVCACD
jgi:hypothetical protein